MSYLVQINYVVADLSLAENLVELASRIEEVNNISANIESHREFSSEIAQKSVVYLPAEILETYTDVPNNPILVVASDTWFISFAIGSYLYVEAFFSSVVSQGNYATGDLTTELVFLATEVFEKSDTMALVGVEVNVRSNVEQNSYAYANISSDPFLWVLVREDSFAKGELFVEVSLKSVVNQETLVYTLRDSILSDITSPEIEYYGGFEDLEITVLCNNSSKKIEVIHKVEFLPTWAFFKYSEKNWYEFATYSPSLDTETDPKIHHDPILVVPDPLKIHHGVWLILLWYSWEELIDMVLKNYNNPKSLTIEIYNDYYKRKK